MAPYYVYMLRCFDGSGEFDRIEDAIAFEKRLKRWTHAKKRAFAERDWPLLKRLARGRS